MRRYKFLVSFLCCIIIFATFSSGLSVYAESATATPSESAEFRVGMECGYAPYNWTQFDDKNGAVPIFGSPGQYANGYDVQIAKKVAEDMGRELVIVKVSWDGLIPALQSKKIDAIAAGMSATAERKLAINFSDSYYYSQMVVVVKKDGIYANATKLSDFSGAKLTGQLGTLHYDLIDQVEDVKKETALEDFPTMIVALKSGVVDGYLSEKPGAISAANANDELTYIEFPTNQGFIFDDAEISIGVGVRLNDGIVDEINSALAKITQQEREELMESVIKIQPTALNSAEESETTAPAVPEDSLTSQEETENTVSNASSPQKASFFSSVKRIVQKYWRVFLNGAKTTIFIALIGTIIGLIIGILVATFRNTPSKKFTGIFRVIHKTIDILLGIYIEVFRGTPMMVQAIIFFYGFSYLFNIDLSPIVAGLIILSVNTGAYMAEVVRGGIESVPSGQFEGATAVGMTYSQTMLNVVLPQAIRNILPATGNEFVINIKDTSVLNVIMVTELFFATKSVNTNTAAVFETYFISAVIYLVLTFTVTRILKAIERKMDGPENYTLTSSSTHATVTLHQKQGGNK